MFTNVVKDFTTLTAINNSNNNNSNDNCNYNYNKNTNYVNGVATPPESPKDEQLIEQMKKHQLDEKVFPIMKVPMEIMDIIMEYCDAQALTNLQQSCRAMRCVIRPTLWNEVRIEFDGMGKQRSEKCLAPPEVRYRHKNQWNMNIDARKVDGFVERLKNDDYDYLFWTRHLMIKSPVHDDLTPERIETVKWLLENIVDHLPALDSLDIWGLTSKWYPYFQPLFDHFTSCAKSLHWIEPAVPECVMINNIKSMTLHDELLENLNYAFDMEEFSFYASEPQDTEVLENSLVACSQLKHLTLHIPGIVGKAREWMPTYVEEYEQYFDEAYQEKETVKHEGLKFMRTTIPSGKLIQDFEFPGLERLSIYGGSCQVCPDLFSKSESIKELVLEDIPLSSIIQVFGPLTRLKSVICRGGVCDGILDSPKNLPKQLDYLIIKPNDKDNLNELTVITRGYLSNSNHLRVFIDTPEPIDNHPEWKWVKGAVVSDGFAVYSGTILYEHVL